MFMKEPEKAQKQKDKSIMSHIRPMSDIILVNAEIISICVTYKTYKLETK